MKKYIMISFALVLVDIITKFIVKHSMHYGQSVDIIGSFLRFTYIENTGMAFGLLSSSFENWFIVKNILLSIVSLVLIIFIYKEIKLHGSVLKKISLTLIFGGALGNFLERIFGNILYNFQFSIPFGKVVDFFDIGFGSYRWFIFNMADVFISIGIVLLFTHTLLVKPKK